MPAPTCRARPTTPTRSVASATTTCCAARARARVAGRPSGCSTRSPAELAAAIEHAELARRGRPRRRARRGERAADRAPLGRVPRPAHAARRDQGVGHAACSSTTSTGRAEAQREFLETIDEETDRLNALVGNLLDMSRLQTGALARLATAIGARGGRPAALASLGLARRRRSRSTSPRRCPRVLADPGLLERALANIVGNARRLVAARHAGADRRGRGRRTASTSASSTAAPASRPPIASAIFQPFQRLGDSRERRRASGSASPSRRGSSRRWAASSRSRTRPAAALTMVIRLQAGDVTRDPRRRRRAADPARARHQPQGPRLRRRPRAPTARRRSSSAARQHPDVVVLDLGLPGIDGIEVIRGLRGWTTVPISCSPCATASSDKVAALDAGADDYVTKPFGMDELLARLRAALRRAAPARGRGGRRDAATSPSTSPPSASRRDGVEVRLTPTEWQIVEVLVRNPGKLVSQRQLLQEVWGPQYERRDQLPPRLPRPASAASSSPIRRGRGTSSPSRGWATASSARTPARRPFRIVRISVPPASGQR